MNTHSTHSEAVEEAVAASTLDQSPRYAPLIELCRVLAAQMDGAGAEPSTRLTAAYLSALKDLGRAINVTPVRTSGLSRLDAMRAQRMMAPAPSKKTRRSS